MNIVVLDGYTVNPGDLSWSALQRLGETTVYDRTPPELVAERARGAQIVLTNKTKLAAETLRALPELRYVGVLATGYDVVDVTAAAERGIVVTNVPAYSTESVAQLVLALLLELCHGVGRHDDAVKAGEWTRSADFCFWRQPLVELAGKTLGLVGYGRIGRQVAAVAAALGMRVLYTRRSGGTAEDAAAEPCGARRAELAELLAEADVVSLHCPLTPATEGLINRDTIALMKPAAFLINTSRGKLIAEQDLADALNEGRLAGAALDVLSAEPPHCDNPLLAARNCIITPHIAWATLAARTRLMDIAAGNVAAFLQGQPVNRVN